MGREVCGEKGKGRTMVLYVHVCVCACAWGLRKREGEVGGKKMREARRQTDCFSSAIWLNVFFLFKVAILGNITFEYVKNKLIPITECCLCWHYICVGQCFPVQNNQLLRSVTCILLTMHRYLGFIYVRYASNHHCCLEPLALSRDRFSNLLFPDPTDADSSDLTYGNLSDLSGTTKRFAELFFPTYARIFLKTCI